MFAWILAIVVLLAVFAYVGWRLYRSNMTIPPKAEQALSPREALRFAAENDLPIGRTILSDRQQAVPGIGHNGGPPLKDWE
jgi:hypothetical protein